MLREPLSALCGFFAFVDQSLCGICAYVIVYIILRTIRDSNKARVKRKIIKRRIQDQGLEPNSPAYK